MSDPELKKVLWHCRRGSKELDLILENFVESRYRSLEPALREQFDKLLQIQDPVLAEWLCFEQCPDARFSEIVDEILKTTTGSKLV